MNLRRQVVTTPTWRELTVCALRALPAGLAHACVAHARAAVVAVDVAARDAATRLAGACLNVAVVATAQTC